MFAVHRLHLTNNWQSLTSVLSLPQDVNTVTVVLPLAPSLPCHTLVGDISRNLATLVGGRLDFCMHHVALLVHTIVAVFFKLHTFGFS